MPFNRPTLGRVFAVATLGAFLVQLAWVLAVPPFWGLDERDHAYRAAAVARGDWSPHHAPSPDDPWEVLEVVPAGLVEAGGAVCAYLWRYSNPANCRPAEVLNDDEVVMSSAPATYNPLFYYAIGAPARAVGTGYDLYVYRLLASLMCAVLIGAAVAIAATAFRTLWPLVALLAAATPTFWYSTAIAAPNGVEMCAGLLLWVSLLAVVRTPPDEPIRKELVRWATAAGMVVVTPRSLGPVWLALILVAVAIAAPPGSLQRLRRTPAIRYGAALVLVAVAASVAWSLMAGTNQGAVQSPDGGPLAPEDPHLGLGELIGFSIFWVIQTIGVFPGRLTYAPVLVYVLVALPWLLLGFEAWRRASVRHRLALAFALAVTIGVPLVLTLRTYALLNLVWQGRYALPFSVGCALLCGFILDRRGAATPTWAPWAVGGLSAVALALSVAKVVRLDLGSLVPELDMVHAPVSVVAALAIAGMMLIVTAGTRARAPERRLAEVAR